MKANLVKQKTQLHHERLLLECIDCNVPGHASLMKALEDEERTRVTKAGGVVEWDRVGGCLAVSRALGDYEFKFVGNTYPRNVDFIVSSVAQVSQVNISDATEFLILACDGLWDALSNAEAISFVSTFFKDRPDRGQDRSTYLSRAAEALVSHAIDRGSMDNVTAIIVTFH